MSDRDCIGYREKYAKAIEDINSAIRLNPISQSIIFTGK